MRLHSFALFLMGWYLLMPVGSEPDQSRLSGWHQVSSWDTAAGCRAAQEDYWNWVNKATKKGGSLFAGAPPGFRGRQLATAERTICVESGDPRLAR